MFKKTISELALKLHSIPAASTLSLTNNTPTRSTAPHLTPTLSTNKNSSTSSLAFDSSPSAAGIGIGSSKRSVMMLNKRELDQIKSESAMFSPFTKSYDVNKYLDCIAEQPILEIPKKRSFINLIKGFGVNDIYVDKCKCVGGCNGGVVDVEFVEDDGFKVNEELDDCKCVEGVYCEVSSMILPVYLRFHPI